jgi:hypothetical protein
LQLSQAKIGCKAAVDEIAKLPGGQSGIEIGVMRLAFLMLALGLGMVVVDAAAGSDDEPYISSPGAITDAYGRGVLVKGERMGVQGPVWKVIAAGSSEPQSLLIGSLSEGLVEVSLKQRLTDADLEHVKPGTGVKAIGIYESGEKNLVKVKEGVLTVLVEPTAETPTAKELAGSWSWSEDDRREVLYLFPDEAYVEISLGENGVPRGHLRGTWRLKERRLTFLINGREETALDWEVVAWKGGVVTFRDQFGNFKPWTRMK